MYIIRAIDLYYLQTRSPSPLNPSSGASKRHSAHGGYLALTPTPSSRASRPDRLGLDTDDDIGGCKGAYALHFLFCYREFFLLICFN